MLPLNGRSKSNPQTWFKLQIRKSRLGPRARPSPWVPPTSDNQITGRQVTPKWRERKEIMQ